MNLVEDVLFCRVWLKDGCFIAVNFALGDDDLHLMSVYDSIGGDIQCDVDFQVEEFVENIGAMNKDDFYSCSSNYYPLDAEGIALFERLQEARLS